MRSDDQTLNRLFMLMAGSGMSDEQLLKLIRRLRSMPASRILEQINLYREAISLEHWEEEPISFRPSNEHSFSIDQDAVDAVERLAVAEAGLPKAIAARAVSLVLRQRHPGTHIPTFNPKDGFAKWVRQVAEVVSLGELLHVAALIRNERVHAPTDDWIKGKK